MITFEGMKDALGLTHAPDNQAREIMNEVVLSAPGIMETEEGYSITSKVA